MSRNLLFPYLLWLMLTALGISTNSSMVSEKKDQAPRQITNLFFSQRLLSLLLLPLLVRPPPLLLSTRHIPQLPLLEELPLHLQKPILLLYLLILLLDHLGLRLLSLLCQGLSGGHKASKASSGDGPKTNCSSVFARETASPWSSLLLELASTLFCNQKEH